ncbi:MAG: 30S ribosomal protein S9 [Elusimicrobiales bacterium]
MTDTITATGRRKTSVAQVVATPGGDGAITINGKPMAEYFRGCPRFQLAANAPVVAVEAAKTYAYKVKVDGGGVSSQAGAVRHAIARAVATFSEADHKTVKKLGYLTRDARMVERKKPGRPKARRRFQFSKR